MKKNCKWWGGQLEFISLVHNYICTQNTFKILNKDFIKALRGGVTVLWNFFIKCRFFMVNASLIANFQDFDKMKLQ